MATTTFEIERTSKFRRVLGQVLPYVILTLSIIPILVGYAWVVIATFSQRTHGLLPVDSQGIFGGLTLANWTFLAEPEDQISCAII